MNVDQYKVVVSGPGYQGELVFTGRDALDMFEQQRAQERFDELDRIGSTQYALEIAGIADLFDLPPAVGSK